MNIDYNKIANCYAKHRKIDSNALKGIIKGSGINNTSRVLEIGCGTGNYISAIYNEIKCPCYGIDPSIGMIDEAKRANEEINFSVGYAEALKFDNHFFSTVFSVDVIHHVTDHNKYFQEAFRVLKPGGYLITLTDSEETIRKRMPLAFYFPETIQHELKRYPGIDLLKEYSMNAGFRIIGEDIVETPFKLMNMEKYRKKAFSCLRLISSDLFKFGIEKMENDLLHEPIKCVSRNYVLSNKKSFQDVHELIKKLEP